MASKKQKREAAEAKRAEFMEAQRLSGLVMQGKDKERREVEKENAKRSAERRQRKINSEKKAADNAARAARLTAAMQDHHAREEFEDAGNLNG